MQVRNHLKQPIERDPEEKYVREKLKQHKAAVYHPVSQPFCIVILLFALNGLNSVNG